MKLPIDNNDKSVKDFIKEENHPSDKADISKQSYLKEENLFPVIKRQRWEQGAGG